MHFEREAAYYKSINIVNLLHQSSKEEALCRAYTEHALYYNSPNLTYITFDFNEHCRGMRFENVLLLTQNIENLIQQSSFTWTDVTGRICEQTSVFRVNCMDCLDRTNIVEAAICRIVLEMQCGKMGLLPPDSALPDVVLKVFKTLWANNGDVISKQYAGTNALKGDYTRTGEHNVLSAMKDGMNSANRYYLNQFQDANRQMAIDVSHGVQTFDKLVAGSGGLFSPSPSSNNLQSLDDANSPENLQMKCENLLAVMEDVRKMLLTDEDLCLGSWLLYDCSDSSQQLPDTDFDIIMVLSLNSIFIVRLDLEGDPLFYYDIPLSLIEKVECGQLSLNNSNIWLPFGKKASNTAKNTLGGLKITYHQPSNPQKSGGDGGLEMMKRSSSGESLIFVLRTAKFRLFSGILIPVESLTDAHEVLTMICECFRNVSHISNISLNIVESNDIILKVDRKKTARIDSHPNKIMWADSGNTLQALTIQQPHNDPNTVQTVVQAPKKLFDTFKTFSNNLLKPGQSGRPSDSGSVVSSSSPRNSRNSVPGGSSSDAPPLGISPPPTGMTQSASDEWKQDMVKQMPEFRTKIIQL